MKRHIAAFWVPYFVAVCVFALGWVGPHDGRDKAELLRAKAHSLISELTDGPDAAPGAAAYIIAPALDMEYGVAAGTTERGGRELLTIEHPVRISSVTKPFVAAAILRLWEIGEIELDHPIGSYVNPAHADILAAGGYDVKVITVRHLLTHTAGLVDVFFTDAFGQMEPRLMSGELKHRFTVDEQLQLAMEGGPNFAPGTAFEYSDTGYILLGSILENITGQSMAAATRDLVGFDRLGLADTWWEVLETEPEGVLARPHQYFGVYDSYDENPPFDLLGGGGIVSTPKDLARFFHALFNGQIFRESETINVMVSVVETVTPREQEAPYIYGHGLQIREIGNLIVYGHRGWWGIYAGYAPALNMSVSVIGLKQEFYFERYPAVAWELMSEAARLQAER